MLAAMVFTTAYSEYAVRAFDIQALDYLLKPFDRERFMQSVQRVGRNCADPEPGDLEERVRRVLAAMPGQAAPVRQILVRDKSAPISSGGHHRAHIARRETTWRSTPPAKCTWCANLSSK